jgi:hypothetical protein
MSKDSIRSILELISNSLDDMYDDDEIEKLHNGLCTGVGYLIYKKDIINRLGYHYPIGGYVTPKNCRAEWNDNILEIHVEGWRHTVVSYKYVDGLYYKCNISSWNINGRGTPINESYTDSKGLTEDELFREVNMIED